MSEKGKHTINYPWPSGFENVTIAELLVLTVLHLFTVSPTPPPISYTTPYLPKSVGTWCYLASNFFLSSISKPNEAELS